MAAENGFFCAAKTKIYILSLHFNAHEKLKANSTMWNFCWHLCAYLLFVCCCYYFGNLVVEFNVLS